MDAEQVFSVILKILGLAPYSSYLTSYLRGPRIVHRRTFRRSLYWEFYSFIIYVLSIVGKILLLFIKYESYSPMKKISTSFSCLLNSLMLAYLAVTVLARSKKLIACLNDLMIVRCNLSNWDEERNSVKYYYLYMSSVIVEIVALSVFTKQDFLGLHMYYLLSTITQPVVFGSLLLYGFMVHIVLNELVTLNSILRCLTQPTGRGSVYVIEMVPRNEEQILSTLHFLRSVYASLCEISDVISDTLSVHSLLATVNYFIIFCRIAHNMVTGFMNRTVDVWYTFSLGALLLSLVLRLYVTTQLVTLTIREAKRTGELAENGVAYTRDTARASKLRDFAQYVLHKGITFTAGGGIISMDNALFLSVISSTLTYAIIMIQYDLGTKHRT